MSSLFNPLVFTIMKILGRIGMRMHIAVAKSEKNCPIEKKIWWIDNGEVERVSKKGLQEIKNQGKTRGCNRGLKRVYKSLEDNNLPFVVQC